ncbi:nitrilase-related carbon-nitrogen hydrolase [Streptomyces sp. NEAU-YJ-81]|uniref:nitrilase-related carbon-nitrogen hydrolase n=1 Tax=Streptomyces sp. NEAU-YJ-81 TaxID=2820288 RepID=UPI001ABC9D99|nr:nitrilase-related carbon-nitrogen hydrolase [Streptomyces sp. NEAU-YJ-81]MBO3680486.1 amidohydrolase [Streptomyces sp. NEAU-YJ-81]
MPRTLSVSAAQFQMRAVPSFDAFAGQVRALLDRTAGTRLVVLPELFTEALFTIDSDWRSHEVGRLTRIADFTDEYVELFTAEARARGQWILAGSHLTATEHGHENIAHLFGPGGEVHTHSKTHIFPAEADWGTVEGDELAVHDVDGVTVGIAICYEAEIPEVCTALTALGAEVLLTPSYTFTEAGFWRVRHCAAARAIEDQVYVVHCPTVSRLPEPLAPGFGRASLLSPCDLAFPANGVLAEARTNEEDVITYELDLDLLHRNRASGAAPTHRDRIRRRALYTTHAQLSG